jgi:peptidoglycan/xylan/chitin deacetylase (PgdA/CDA1 family)
VKISKSDYYRNEFDIEYSPPAAFQLGAGAGLIDYIPYQIRNSFVSLLSLMRPRSAGAKRREFPIDDLADRLDATTEEKREFWEKDFGVIMTHDVDTRVGYEYGMNKFVEFEKREDLVSTFNIVPQSFEYELSVDIVKALVKDGFDIGMHGLHHDGKYAYLSEDAQRARVEDAARKARELSIPVLGYRAPLLHRTKKMIQFLTETGYEWDSSFPDTDDSTVGYATTGCRTLFPFYPLYKEGTEWKRSPMLEIPVSMPQDWTLLYYYRLSEESMLRVWKKKMQYIKSRGGLAVFILHPDPEDFGHPKYHKSYRSLLKIIKDADPEILTCSQLAERWKRKFPPKKN